MELIIRSKNKKHITKILQYITNNGLISNIMHYKEKKEHYMCRYIEKGKVIIEIKTR